LVGAISGDVSAEAKLDLVRAVAKAKREGMAVQKACAVLSLPRVTYYHWLGGHQLEEVTLAELTDRRAEPKPSPQRVTEAEREAIVAAAKDEVKVDLHHRKLAHTLGREEGVYVSESTVYRVLTQFEQAGLLARQHFETGKAVFELNQGGHHDHLVCLQCGRVEEFFDGEIEKRQGDIARKNGFELRGHSLALYADCTKANCPNRPV